MVLVGLLAPLAGGAALPNDNLADALLITGGQGSQAGTTLGSRLEPGEPLHAGAVSGGSVWYKWGAFSGGSLTLQATGTRYTARVAVYRQTDSRLDYTHLAPVASGLNGAATVALQPGSAYLIAITCPVQTSGPFTLAWKHTPPAGGGVDLAILPGSVHASVVTKNFDRTECEVVNGCATAGTNRLIQVDFEVANRGAEDIYMGNPTRSPWAVTLPCVVEFHFRGLHRYVLRDARNAIVAMAEPVEHCFEDNRRENPNAIASPRYNCADQGLSAGWIYSLPSSLPCHFLNVSDVPSGSYTLEVIVDPWNYIDETDESNNSAKIPIVIEPECTGPPPNDNRAAATVVTGAIATVGGNSECATIEAGEKAHSHGVSFMPPGRSIWYQWIAPYTGDVTVDTEGSNYDTALEVQTASPDGSVNGPYLTFNDDVSPGVHFSRIAFPAVVGTPYWFVVDGYNVGAGSEGGRVQLNLNAAGNDSVTNAQVLVGLEGTTSGTTLHAARGESEPMLEGNPGGHLVWFRWTAPASGPVQFDTEPSAFKTLLGVFGGAGDSQAPLVPVVADVTHGLAGAARAGFAASSGQSYLIALDGRDGAAGVYALAWHQVPDVVVEVRLTARRDAEGRVRLEVTGKPGQAFSIERSSDLKSWAPVGTATVVEGAAVYVDGIPAAAGQGFYRAVGN